MRKFGILFILLLSVLSLVACSSQNQGDSDDELTQLINNIAIPKEEVFKNQNFEEGKDIEPFKDDFSGLYELQEERKLYGESFRLFLHFDINNDKMYAIDFRKSIEDRKDAYDLTQKLFKDLNDSYGDPTTYPGILDRVSSMPDYKDVLSGREYQETWEVDEILQVRLSSVFYDDQTNLVIINYRIKRDISAEEWENM